MWVDTQCSGLCISVPAVACDNAQPGYVREAGVKERFLLSPQLGFPAPTITTAGSKEPFHVNPDLFFACCLWSVSGKAMIPFLERTPVLSLTTSLLDLATKLGAEITKQYFCGLEEDT